VRLHLVLFCLLAATACDEKSPIGPPTPLNEQFTLGLGDAAPVQGTGIAVLFVQVTNDSRCPADALCIQGGDAIVHVRIFENSGTTDYELHTGDARQSVAVHRDFTIELVRLEPYPFSSRPIDPSDYRATLLVRR
jgi:hypothetical protein